MFENFRKIGGKKCLLTIAATKSDEIGGFQKGCSRYLHQQHFYFVFRGFHTTFGQQCLQLIKSSLQLQLDSIRSVKHLKWSSRLFAMLVAAKPRYEGQIPSIDEIVNNNRIFACLFSCKKKIGLFILNRQFIQIINHQLITTETESFIVCAIRQRTNRTLDKIKYQTICI